MPLSAFRVQGLGFREGSHPHALERLCQGSVVGVECLNLALQAGDLGRRLRQPLGAQHSCRQVWVSGSRFRV